MADPAAQREVLKIVATALKRAEVRFALAGSYAGWARGAPESAHDVDFIVHPDDMSAAMSALLETQLREVDAPEDWLVKVTTLGVVVDIIYVLPMGQVDDDLLERTDLISVESVRMPVLSATDLLVSKLLALNERDCDLAPPLSLARSVREQLDWRLIAKITDGNPFAHSFLVLCTELGIVEEGIV
jgi:hypothetical protein